jgi:predicted  nucleic acid-binding Zn-ribbon protein
MEEENEKLKSDLAFERTMLDNVRAEYESLQNVIKNLKSELSKYKKYYDRDKEELMESCYSLARENDELKKQIENLNGIAKMLI